MCGSKERPGLYRVDAVVVVVDAAVYAVVVDAVVVVVVVVDAGVVDVVVDAVVG